MQIRAMRQTYNIHAYPTHLINLIELPNGKRVTVRPALPQDAPLEQQFFESLSPESLKSRFNGCAPSAQYARIDYVNRMGLVVTGIDEHGETVVAHASYRLIDDDTADFGLAVSEDWRRLGIGKRLIETLATAANDAGARWLLSDSLATNIPMLALMLSCGFIVGEHPADAALVQLQRGVKLASTDGRVVHRSGDFLATLKVALPKWFNQNPTKLGLRTAAGASSSDGPGQTSGTSHPFKH